ncbi:hypothetical protein DXG03_008930 [Asterophora parasitica]|uniref:Protein YOP1 n=1 Tax=Asterophora parasitica TaxID=117018 RepID=A0A9P7GIE3_9AGAR|nr:hypothetical protein DXG03_008930 [Asterophora parasitica]
MFMALISHAVSAWFAFLLPCYATFKALSHRPQSEPELQRWSTYWVVIGAFVTFEYLSEWLISWLPFYWEVKTLFLLFLALPQTEPFFIKHERELDAGIISVQGNLLAYLQSRLAALWAFVWNAANKAPASANGQAASGQTTPTGTGGPSFSLESAMSLWKTYGPLINGGGSQAARSATPNASSTSLKTPSTGHRTASNSETNMSNPFSVPTSPSFPEPHHYKAN